MGKSLQILKRFKRRAGCRSYWVWETNKGQLSTKKVAKLIGCNPNTLAQWLRKVDGDVSDPWFQAKIRGEEPTGPSTVGAADWGDLGGEPRTEGLKDIPSPGSLERS